MEAAYRFQQWTPVAGQECGTVKWDLLPENSYREEFSRKRKE
jgi:hypothetical protein